MRSWVASIDGGRLEALTAERVKATRISPDDLSYLTSTKGELVMHAIAGGRSAHLCDLEPGQSVVRWSPDGRYLFLSQTDRRTLRITRLEVANGHKELWRELKVPESGAEFHSRVLLSSDGKAIACSFQHDLSNLYLINGPK